MHAQTSTHTSASVHALTSQRAASRSTAQRAAQLQCQVRAHDSSRYFRYIPVGQRGQALGEAEGVKVHPPIQSSGVRFPPPIIWCPCQSSGAPIQSSGVPSTNHLAPIIWRTRVRVANRLAFLKTTHLVLSQSFGESRIAGLIKPLWNPSIWLQRRRTPHPRPQSSATKDWTVQWQQ